MRAWISLVVLVGCAEPQGALPLPEPDVAFYEAHVHPIARWSCATLECHGVDGRPLRLYGEEGLRATDALRGEPLSAFEARENVLAFAAVDPAPVSIDQHIVLTKPLALDAGGLEHLGDELWPDREDPSYLCLRGWLTGDPSVAAVCDEAARLVEPPL